MFLSRMGRGLHTVYLKNKTLGDQQRGAYKYRSPSPLPPVIYASGVRRVPAFGDISLFYVISEVWLLCDIGL